MHRVFTISLIRSTTRREQFAQQNSWLDFEFFDAVDAFKAKIPFLGLVSKYFGKNDFSLGAFGCLLSHRRLWKQLVMSDYDSYIIFEDDVIISEKLYKKWFDVILAQKDADLIFMGAHDGLSVPDITKIYAVIPGYGFISEPFYHTLYCSYAYVITKKGAQKMLARTKIGYSVDYWSHYSLDNEMKYLVVYPNIAKPSESSFNSLIQTSKSKITTFKKLHYLLSCISMNIKSILYKLVK